MTATGKKPQKKIPSEIWEDSSDSVASTSQVKSLLRKQVKCIKTHTLSLVRNNLYLYASQAIIIIIIIIITIK